MPSELIVQVVKIDKVSRHPTADRLDLVQVGGWQCVVGRDNYKEGDLVVYVPPDSILPVELSNRLNVTQYLSKQRVKAIKLRQEPSFGLIINNEGNWKEGTRLEQHYGITKYMPPIRGQSSPGAKGERSVKNNPLFVKYSSPENLRHFMGILEEGEEVYMSEKCHGCLSYYTKVTLANGKSKYVSKINIGDLVLCLNKEGQVVPGKVTNTFKNGSTNKWLKIKGTRTCAGKGNSFFSVTCTPEHKFWMPGLNEYKKAGLLTVGEEASVVRNDLVLTPVQEQVVLGKLLGDAYLAISSCTAAITFGHKKEHERYLDWTCRALGELAANYKDHTTSGYGSEMVRTRTLNNFYLYQKFKDFYPSAGKKCIPNWVADELTPLAIAFWYMDDGSLGHTSGQEDRASFATCGFTKSDCEVLARGLKKFNINSIIHSNKGKHFRIRLNADDAEKLFLLIAPYIPDIMQYKLPERYRGHTGWVPPTTNIYKPRLTTQTITSIEEMSIKGIKYDLETEYHNYFANKVLTHNSNVRVGIIDGEWCGGSNQVQRLMPLDIKLEHLKNTNTLLYMLELIKEHVKRSYGYTHSYIGRRTNQLWSRFLLWGGLDSEDGGLNVLNSWAAAVSKLWRRLGQYKHSAQYQETNRYWFPYYIGGVRDLLTSLSKAHKQVILFGELLGADVQKLDYGFKKGTLGFRAFDLYIDGKYVDFYVFKDLCDQFKVPRVPELYVGPYSFDKVKALASGNTLLNANHIKEGLVCKPIKERTSPKIGRVILKYVSDAYLIWKDGKEELDSTDV